MDPRSKFLLIVEQVLFENPEWLAGVITCSSQGVLRKLDEERKVSVNIQTSLQMLYEYRFGKLNPAQKKKVLESILECDTIQGTAFADKIRTKLDREANRG